MQASSLWAYLDNTALKIAQATKEAGEASKKPIELKIEQTNKEITDLEKSLKVQNVEIGANEIVRTTAIAQKAMEELNQTMIETDIKKETKDAIIESTIKNVTNLEVQIALGVAKTKETNKQRNSRPREKPKNPKRNNKTNNSRGSQRKCKNSRGKIKHHVIYWISSRCGGMITFAYPEIPYHPIETHRQENKREWASALLDIPSDQLKKISTEFLIKTQYYLISEILTSSALPTFTILVCFHHHLHYFKKCLTSIQEAIRCSPSSQIEILLILFLL